MKKDLLFCVAAATRIVPILLRGKKTLMAFIFWVSCLSNLMAVAVSWTGGAADGNKWMTAGNWSTAAVPSSADDVTIDANVTIEFAPTSGQGTTQTIRSITIPSMRTVIITNNGGGTRTISFSAGTSSVIGTLQIVPVNATALKSIAITMASSAILNVSGILDIGGNATATSNSFTAAAGTLNVSGTASFYNSFSAASGTVNVSGTILYYNSITTTGGTVNVNSGGKIVSTSTSNTPTSDAASLLIKTGGTWEHQKNGGTLPVATFQVNSILLITGINSSAPTFQTSAVVASYGTITINNAAQAVSIILPTGITIGTLNVVNTGTGSNAVRLVSSTTAGVVTLTITDALNISSGTNFGIIYASGSNAVLTSATVTIGSSGIVTINSGGTFTMADKEGYISNLNLSGSSSLINNGTLACPKGSYIDGAGSISLNSGALTRIGDPNGIVASSTTTGNIRNSGSRSLDPAHQWYYYSTSIAAGPSSVNSVTGSGLPSTCGKLTVYNNTAITNNTYTLTLSNPLTISINNITLTGTSGVPPATLVVGANTLTLGGTSPAGAGGVDATNASATVAFTNTSAITLLSTFFTGNPNNLTINGIGGVTLGATTTATTLTLTSGKITLGANTLTANTISGGSSSSYVVTDGAGVLTSPTTAATLKTFPIGASTTSYDPVDVTPTNGVTFSAKVATSFVNAVSDNTKVAAREWNVSATGAGSTVMSLTNGGTAYTPTTARIGHYTGSAWEEFAATFSANTWTATNASGSFSPFGGGNLGAFNSAVLAVELQSFTAVAKGSANRLTWTTNQEKNHDSFIIERSFDGKDFKTIGTVKGQGASNLDNNYTFNDETPLSISYYRLKMKDLNGKESISKAVSVVKNSDKLTIVKGATRLNTEGGILEYNATKEGKVSMTLTDMSGRIIKTKNLDAQTGLNQVSFDSSNLAQGLYILSLNDGDVWVTEKVVKQ